MKPPDASAVLFGLRVLHLLAAALWLGLVLFVDRVAYAFLADADPVAERALLPRVCFWYAAGGAATLLTGFADYVLVLRSEGIALRALVWLAAWTAASAGVLALERPAAAAPAASVRRRALSGVLVVWLVAVAASGDWYMRRGGSHKAVALSLGGGIAFVMLANTVAFIRPDGVASPERRGLFAFAARVNFYLAIAVLFFMGAASHFPIVAAAPGGPR